MSVRLPTNNQSLWSRPQLVWRCRRGMLELDVLLAQFLEQHLYALTHQQRLQFQALLSWSDDKLYQLLVKGQPFEGLNIDEKAMIELINPSLSQIY